MKSRSSPPSQVDKLLGLTEKPINTQSLVKAIWSPAAGALATFEGRVRNRNRGREVIGICYEAYVAMAEKQIEALAGMVKSRWMTDQIAIVHRLGDLEVGEVAVAVVVGAPHRDAAFEACRFAIDQLKVRVPIWKKERYLQGEAWLHGA